MKKILFIVGLLIGFQVAFSQSSPTFLPPRSSATTTVQDSRLRALLTFYYPHTHGLTLNGGLDTLGAVIYEDSSGHVWYRDTIPAGGHRWRMMLSFGDPTGGVSSFNTRTGAVTLTSGDVITALTYTPINPNGTSSQYIAGDGSKVTFPTIPEQINITDAGLFVHSGSYPNYTFTGNTPTQQQVFTQGSTLNQNNFWVTGANVLGMTGTAAFGLPTGSTSQRPSSAGVGYFRYNTDSASTETYNGSQWIKTGTGTAITGVTSFNTRTGAVTLNSSDVTTALAFTPYNSTNPAGYISNITGKIINGANIVITGSGTGVDPYVIIGTGGGGGGGNTNSNIGSGYRFAVPNTNSIKTLFCSGCTLDSTTNANALTLTVTGGSGITQLTGDGTAGPGSGSQAFTLTTVNSNVGTFGSASSVPVFVVNGKGLVTGVTNTSIQITESQVTNLTTDLAGKQPTGNYITGITGDVVATGPGSVASTIQANAVTTGKINNNAVTYAKFQASSQAALLGTNAAGNFGEITLGTGLSFSGSVLNATGGGSQTLTYTQLALNNTLSISGGNTQTFLVATHALAGLMDSASKAVVDSLRLRTYTFPSGSGLTAGGGFSPLFTNTVTGSTLNFVASNAAANSAFGNFTGSPAPAAFGKLPLAAMATGTANTLIGYDGSGNPSGITVGSGLSLVSGTLSSTAGGGSVTSVGLALPASLFAVSGSPVTGAGTLTGSFNTQNAGFVLVSDSVNNGQVPTMRHLVVKDLPVFSPWPAEAPMGTIYSKSAWSLPVTDFIPGPIAQLTYAISTEGYLNVTGPSAVTFNNYARVLQQRPTQLPRFTETVVFKMLTTPAAGTVGFGIGIKQNNGAIGDFTAYVNTTNSGSSGFLTIVRSDGSVTYQSGSSSNTVHLNDVMQLKVVYADSVVTAFLTNITTGITSTPLVWTNTIPSAVSPLFTDCSFSFTPFGPATYQIQSYTITSETIRNANMIFIGDSKTQGFKANFFNGRFGWQMGQSFPSAVIWAGGSNKTTDVLLQMDELSQLNGANIFMSLGSNDIRGGATVTATMINYNRIVNMLRAYGANVYHMVFPEDSTSTGVGLTALKNAILATYPTTYIDTWDTLSTAGNNILRAAYQGDAVHPNQAGNDAIVRAINASGFGKVIATNRKSAYRITDGNIKFNGDSLFLFPIDKNTNYVNHWTSNGSFTTGLLQDNGIVSGASASPLAPVANTIFNVNGVLGIQGTSGGILFSGRDNADQTIGEAAIFCSNYAIRYFANGVQTFSVDSAGRAAIGNVAVGNGVNAFLSISPGLAARPPLRFTVNGSVLTSTPQAGALEVLVDSLYFTGNNGTRNKIWPQSASGGNPFADNTALVKNNADNTKLLILSAASISTATTRTATFPDANITVADKLSPLSQFASTTSAQLLGVISDETGTGSLVFGTSPTIATPLFTGLTSSGANDSVLTVDPTTGQLHRRSGAFNLFFANGLTAAGGDSAYWGGTLNQPTTISGAGFPVSLGTSGSNLGGLSITGGKYNSAQGSQILGVASTINNAITAGSGNVTNFSAYAFLAPTITSTNTSVTYTTPSTLYIDNAPTLSTNSSATGRVYALNVNAGINHFGLGPANVTALFDGCVFVGNATITGNTLLGIGPSTATQTAVRFESGVDLTSPASGQMWWNGTNFYFGDAGGIKRDLLNGVHNYVHSIFTPTTGGTVSLINNNYNIINPAGALVALTVNLPSSPSNNDVVYIKYTQTISTVTYANGTVVDGITAPTAGGMVVLTYDSGTTSWY